ncbi:ParA family partition ATPase [Halothiobacillus sp. DCM-1]|uniref:ParA family partition ATPase n=1 Tax=Halothiobacillus sp. DCM-1 TaxID=3112558 RepID=UPI003253D410
MPTRAYTIALANLKGGCGKTTISTNLSAACAMRGRVGLIDADPQGALKHWVDWQQGDSATTTALPTLHAEHANPLDNLLSAQTQNDFVIADCPPSLDIAITQAILTHCDFVLVPVLPSPLDLWASAQTIDIIHQARTQNPSLRAALVLNQTEPKSAMTRAMQQAIAKLNTPVLTTSVRRRAAYRNAVVEGVSVFQLGVRGREAANEIQQILIEVLPQ